MSSASDLMQGSLQYNSEQTLFQAYNSRLPIPALSGLARNGGFGTFNLKKTHLGIKYRQWLRGGGGSQHRGSMGGGALYLIMSLYSHTV